LEYLRSKGIEFEVVEYLKIPFNEAELIDVIVKMNIKPFELVRTQEDLYRKQLKGKNFTDSEWIKILLENPNLIKRPIVVKGYKAVWADPPEEMDRIL
jgi:arsenate reductase (glutaredoxin)